MSFSIVYKQIKKTNHYFSLNFFSIKFYGGKKIFCFVGNNIKGGGNV